MLCVVLATALPSLPDLVGTAAAAQPNEDFVDWNEKEFDYEESEDDKWRELRFELPELPAEDELTVIDFDKTPPGIRFYAQADGFAIGDDRVTRFWLFTRSERGGPYNATYYGLRCETHELKAYAVGNPDRTQRAVRRYPKPRWQPLREYGYEREMSRYWFCIDRTPLDTDQIARNIRHGVNLIPRAFVDEAN